MAEKKCSKCGAIKQTASFCVNRRTKDKLNGVCKECDSAAALEWGKKNITRKRQAQRKWYYANKESENKKALLYYRRNREKYSENARRREGVKRQATPPWDDKEKTMLIYKKASSLGMEVDHIVPLNSKFVCGLHCWWNLQLLAPDENRKKGNRVWPDMP